MARFSAMMKTTAARLSALYFILFFVCALFLVFYITHLAGGFLVNQTQVRLQEELSVLDRTYARGGLRALVRDIDKRSRRPGASVYLIMDVQKRILAGNIAAIEDGVMNSNGWSDRPFRYTRIGDEDADINDPEGPRAIGQIFVFDNGLRILIGRDLTEPERLRVIVRRSLGIALSIMAVGGLLIWIFVGRRALKRIDNVSDASARIAGGDLSERLPITTSNDEFDRLSLSLNQMLDRIEMLNSGLRQVSDSIAHDLKTPLTRLRNIADAALRTGKSEDELRQALSDMIGESDQLIRIFNAMLLISRVEAGYTKHSPEMIKLSEIAADLAELYEPVIEDTGGKLETNIANNLVIAGNRELIGQALTNLIDNAIKYGSGENTHIKISGKQTKDGKNIEIAVEDNGEGIPEEDRKRVFERFVRLDESRSETGSGLGLSLVAAVVKLHKGSVRLEDAEPGLRVVLSFPMS